MLVEQPKEAFDISLQAGRMCLNRFCIDEEAGFEFSAVYRLKTLILEEFGRSMEPSRKPRPVKIESAFQKIAEHKLQDLEVHILHVGRYPGNVLVNEHIHPPSQWLLSQWHKSLPELMKKYQIKSLVWTSIYMEKMKIITKELTESYCKGNQGLCKISVNDDLEAFFEDLQLGKKPKADEAMTYYLPKLTEDEMTLLETKNQNYFRKFSTSVVSTIVLNGDLKNPDVDEFVMNMSESESKFILGKSHRRSFKIQLLNL